MLRQACCQTRGSTWSSRSQMTRAWSSSRGSLPSSATQVAASAGSRARSDSTASRDAEPACSTEAHVTEPGGGPRGPDGPDPAPTLLALVALLRVVVKVAEGVAVVAVDPSAGATAAVSFSSQGEPGLPTSAYLSGALLDRHPDCPSPIPAAKRKGSRGSPSLSCRVVMLRREEMNAVDEIKPAPPPVS